MTLIPPQYKLAAMIAAGAALALASAATAWTVRGWQADAAVSKLAAAHAAAVTAAQKKERDNLAQVLNEERAAAAAAQESLNALQARMESGRQSAADLQSELQRVRDANRRAPAAWSCAPGAAAPAAERAASAPAAGVVPSQLDRAGLFDESATGLAELAQYAMACHNGHSEMTRLYDKLRAAFARYAPHGRTVELAP